jgi:hypothetical protein
MAKEKKIVNQYDFSAAHCNGTGGLAKMMFFGLF